MDKASQQYGPVKEVCDKQLGVPSQNMLIQKMQKAGPQYFANVALKVNVKVGAVVSEADCLLTRLVQLGGINHLVYSDQTDGLPGFNHKRTLVFGAESARTTVLHLSDS